MKRLVKFVIVYSSEKTGTIVMPMKSRQNARDVKKVIQEFVKYAKGSKSVHIERHQYLFPPSDGNLENTSYSKQKVY